MSVFLEIDPDRWIGANDLAFAIRDGFAVSPGHSLIVTRRVVATWWDATSDERAALLDLLDVVKLRLDAEFAPDGYNVGINAGEAAGQTVPHLHVHLIPRYDGDTDDPRGGVRHVIPGRGNYLAPVAQPGATANLVTSSEGRMTLELIRCLIREDLDRIDLLVSFVMQSGVDLISGHLDDALARGAHVRLLTTDYLYITDSAALGHFLDRIGDAEPGRLEARVFSDAATSFHPKAYIFTSSTTGAAVAFVGSSNLSRSGIATGVEWNLEVRRVDALVREFNGLWDDPRSIPLTTEWLLRYREARALARANEPALTAAAAGEVGPEAADETVVQPWSVQQKALTALTATRIDGHTAGLVVMATGLGKTWLAAFDSTRPEFTRVLFVAHREEILRQARDVFRRIRSASRLTLYIGDEHEPNGDVVFASVQSLHRNLAEFRPDEFDYIVVDEFHHATADTYRRVIGHFRPRFLLGLTATPDRADNADLLALCSDNLVYDCGLVEGVTRGLLSPFRYRAIPDVADYAEIPWRNGRFDPETLTAQIATQERAEQVLREWRALGGVERRALGFCCTIAHAEFMAEQFRAAGVAAVAVHSGPSSAARGVTLERLATGEIPIVFTVDLFNEGVDIPRVDVVMMLRPTESAVVFLQQLGRGLRRSANKERLDVIDLVGNHRGFLLKARLLAALAGRTGLTAREAVSLLADEADALADGHGLPDGCAIIVEPEAIELLADLTRTVSQADRIAELIREWADGHDGTRPSAIEVALLTGSALNLKGQGGWFGLLGRMQLISPDEVSCFDLAEKFLLYVEHGSYTKSYKLVTLLALLETGRLTSGVLVAELASTARWMIFRDSDLLGDLHDAASSFHDVTRPTVAEWEAYWRRNPIAALTREGAWFALDDDRLTLQLAVPAALVPTFESMLREIVAYRLHRYLVSRKARVLSESRRPVVDGKELDATFTVEASAGTPSSVVIESAGGAGRSTAAPRNAEYVAGVDVVLERLRMLGAVLMDAYVDTGRTVSMAIADRRLDAGEHDYPIELSSLDDVTLVRKAFLRSMPKIGQQPGAQGGGNARKRARLVISLAGVWSAATLADAIAAGTLPPNEDGRAAEKTA